MTSRSTRRNEHTGASCVSTNEESQLGGQDGSPDHLAATAAQLGKPPDHGVELDEPARLPGSDANLDWLRVRLDRLGSRVQSEIATITALLDGHARPEIPSLGGRDAMRGRILARIPRQGWTKVAVVLKPEKARNQVKYQALRELVERGVLARRRGFVAHRAWVAEQVPEAFGTGSVSCNDPARSDPEEGRP